MDEMYRKLAEHLDRHSGSFAPSVTDADLRLLPRLFEQGEAELAAHMPFLLRRFPKTQLIAHLCPMDM